jgi:DNA-binding SARP family transcriptional activator
MSPCLALYFLGAPQLYLDNSPIPAGRRKVVALLAYLAIERGSHRRESLSALLWPDYDQSKAFTNLRHTLWEIQKSVGEGWLLTDYDKIGLNEAANVWLDLRQFESLLAQSRAERDLPRRISLLVESTKLYRNHFLSGFNLKDAPNFNEWAFAESEDVRCQLAGALTSLSEDYCALGRAEQAIPYARRIITLDPLNESAHRRLMNIYVQAGQHSAALKQYQICEEMLRKELNLDPQPETYALYKQIRKRDLKPAQVVKSPEPVSPRHHLPLQLSSSSGVKRSKKNSQT